MDKSISIIRMGALCPAGRFGYLAMLANNPHEKVAIDAVQMLKPRHGDENYHAAMAAWESLAESFR